MRFFILAVFVFGGLCAQAQKLNLVNYGQNQEYTNGWFGSTDPRQVANDTQPGELAVHKLLVDGGWCSAVMIGPQWAVTAAHCVKDDPVAIQFYRDNQAGPTIEIDHSWYGRYARFLTSDSIEFLYQDFGVVHLQSPAPKWVKFAQIAQPDELYAGEPAKSVGFPRNRFGGDIKVRAGNCSVRRLFYDAILSDCAISGGSSGGALFVYTRSGKWRLGGITSSEYAYTRFGQQFTLHGGPYTDPTANRFVNITYYSGRIANTIMNYDHETLPTLRASLTYPVQCLTRFTDVNWKSIYGYELNDCEEVESPTQLECVSKFFRGTTVPTSQNYQSCLNTK